MGLIVVGDIGTPNRINYTIVGDTVNATQRLEKPQFIERGTHLVEGKEESLKVFQLIEEQEGGSWSV
jgi:adenylate cyclase